MPSTLALPHQLVLLELDDQSGTSPWSAAWSTYLLNGAALGELLFLGVLRLNEDGDVIRGEGTAPDGVLKQAAGILSDGPRTLRKALYALSAWSGGSALRPQVLKELIALGVLREEEDRLLFVRLRVRYPTEDGAVERTLREGLRAYVRDATGPVCREDVLLSLLWGADQLAVVFPPDELAAHGATIEARAALSVVGAAVKGFVGRMESAHIAISQ